jgi:hypothetical protein
MPGPKHEVARGVAVCGFPMALTLTAWMSCWAGAKGYAAGPGARLVPDDLELFDRPPMSGTTMGIAALGTRPTYSPAL